MANILVVQDIGLNTVDLKPCLESSGHQVLIARNVKSAKTLLEAAPFDLVICCAHLQDGTVFDLLTFAKRDLNPPGIPFLLFCCNPTDIAKSLNESVRKTATLLGADKYIVQDTFDADLFSVEINSFLTGIRRTNPQIVEPT